MAAFGYSSRVEKLRERHLTLFALWHFTGEKNPSWFPPEGTAESQEQRSTGLEIILRKATTEQKHGIKAL